MGLLCKHVGWDLNQQPSCQNRAWLPACNPVGGAVQMEATDLICLLDWLIGKHLVQSNKVGSVLSRHINLWSPCLYAHMHIYMYS